jgi:hypothetical protein
MSKRTQLIVTTVIGLAVTLSVPLLVKYEQFGWLLLPAAAIVSIPFLNHVLERQRSLMALLVSLHQALNIPSDAGLRCAILRCCLIRRKMLIQQARYANPPEQRPKTRMQITQGVAGRCYRLHELNGNGSSPVECLVPVVTDLMTLLVKDLGFTKQEAQQFKQDRMSYLCLPVPNYTGKILAILSLDSSKPDTFTEDRIKTVHQKIPEFAQILD